LVFKYRICIEGESMSQVVSGNFTVTVNAAAAALTLTPPSGALPNETQGVADPGDLVTTITGGTQFPASNPTGPYAVAVSSGSLPPGMSLVQVLNGDSSVSLEIEGTPTQSGDFTFAVTVTDANGVSITQSARKRV
jgi:hypothetical protein